MVGRERILKLHAKNKPIAEDVNWESLSRRTVGMSGADLEALLNEAAMVAAKREGEEVSEKDIEIALHTSVLGRERRSAVVTDRDREIVAWHESGHTLAALKLEDAMDPVTVSVVPRGPAGGVTWMDGSEHEFTTKNQLLAQLTVAMSGRAAEEILLDGDYTQGAAGDLQSATSIATLMVTRWGMGRLMISRDEALLKSAEDSIDNEVAEIIQEALVRARIVTLENRALLEALALELLDKETLNLKQIKELVERLSISRKETV
jgi:cell division protease FtsH